MSASVVGVGKCRLMCDEKKEKKIKIISFYPGYMSVSVGVASTFAYLSRPVGVLSMRNH